MVYQSHATGKSSRLPHPSSNPPIAGWSYDDIKNAALKHTAKLTGWEGASAKNSDFDTTLRKKTPHGTYFHSKRDDGTHVLGYRPAPPDDKEFQNLTPKPLSSVSDVWQLTRDHDKNQRG